MKETATRLFTEEDITEAMRARFPLPDGASNVKFEWCGRHRLAIRCTYTYGAP